MILLGGTWMLLAKQLAVCLLAAGTVGAFLPRDLEDRRRAAYWLAGPGFGLCWVLGWLLLWARQVSALSAWVLGAMVVSIFSLNVVLWSVGTEGRRSGTAAALAVGSLALTIALMMLRPG